ncbi:hypothetical protein M4D79_22725 [Mycolicibacterium novocastrense]|nr:hypothetical protein M4D79_22725 [Mycolicibacterium novocastrense]
MRGEDRSFHVSNTERLRNASAVSPLVRARCAAALDTSSICAGCQRATSANVVPTGQSPMVPKCDPAESISVAALSSVRTYFAAAERRCSAYSRSAV